MNDEGNDVADTSMQLDQAQNVTFDCTPVYTLQGHKRSISSLAFSPDGLELASSSADGQLKIWTLATGVLRVTLDATEASILAGNVATAKGISDVAWSRDGRYLVCGGDDKVVRVWDAKRVGRMLLLSRTHALHENLSLDVCIGYAPLRARRAYVVRLLRYLQPGRKHDCIGWF